MNRIDKRFKELKERHEAAFIPFVTACDPDLPATVAIILELEKRGVDIIELGFPFSDPIADGPIIQSSYNRALAKGITIRHILDIARNVRKESNIPLVAMVSYSIIFRFGKDKFVEEAYEAGFDGATIPDLPIEEAGGLFNISARNNFKIICFIAPTTTDERIEMISRMAQGFIYYISVVGITGVRKDLPADMSENINKLRKRVSCPIALGFGISTPEQALAVSKIADGVIVGSAIVREIERLKEMERNELIKNVGEFTERLILATKGRDT